MSEQERSLIPAAVLLVYCGCGRSALAASLTVPRSSPSRLDESTPRDPGQALPRAPGQVPLFRCPRQPRTCDLGIINTSVPTVPINPCIQLCCKIIRVRTRQLSTDDSRFFRAILNE